MATRMTLEDRYQGISPDQARADYLARTLEEVRRLLSTPAATTRELATAVNKARRLLDRIPPQF